MILIIIIDLIYKKETQDIYLSYKGLKSSKQIKIKCCQKIVKSIKILQRNCKKILFLKYEDDYYSNVTNISTIITLSAIIVKRKILKKNYLE